MNIHERRKWNNLLIFICCAFIIVIVISSHEQDEKNLNEVYPTETLKKVVFSNARFQYELNNKKGQWHLVAPFKHFANAKNIEKIAAIQDSPIYKHIKNDDDINEFGFNDKHFLKINKRIIFFGDKALTSKHRYIKIDDRIFLIDDKIYALLASGPAFWLDKQLLNSDELLTSISINQQLYKEADLNKLANIWYDSSANSLLYPADNYITPSPGDNIITIAFANNDTLQFTMHKQGVLVNTAFNLAYKLNPEVAKQLLSP